MQTSFSHVRRNSGLCLPQPCPAQDTLGECFSLLKGPRADILQTARNVLLCQEKPAGSKLPSVLFLEVNVIVLSFFTGFACCYIPCSPCWSRRSHKEAGSLALGFELAFLLLHYGFPVGFWFLEPDGQWCVSSTDLLHWPWRMLISCGAEPLLWCLHGMGGLKSAPSSGHMSSFPFQSFCEGPWKEERIQAASQDDTDPWTMPNLSPCFSQRSRRENTRKSPWYIWALLSWNVFSKIYPK